MNQPEQTIRELMLAVEFLRSICEHTEGLSETDDTRLRLGMQIGIRTNTKFAHLISDYQHSAFWQDVRNLPDTYGL